MAAGLVAALALAGCDNGQPKSDSRQTAKTSAPTHITFVTDWKAQAEHGGFYEALAEGLYKKRGLDVTIMQGGPAVNVPQLLAGGAADFGIGSNGFIPLNMVREGVKVKAVMAVFQKDPQVLITHPRNDVKSISDMKGKPIMIADASTTAFWPWLKAKYGFSDSQIRKYTFNLAPFLVDPTAIQEGYLSSEPYTVEQQAHFKPQVFLLADNGYPGYANMVLVPQKWIDENPKAVQAFVDATAEGWTDYLYGDPTAANTMIKNDNPEMTDDLIAQAIQKMRSYGIALSGDATTHGIGVMTDARWKTFFDTMSSEGLYDKSLNYTKSYDLRFVRAMPKPRMHYEIIICSGDLSKPTTKCGPQKLQH
ncbi:MAG: ABC transporter substrate-binding protein [Proteobacteria bacterium]|nr:ABC transporter substrate-binding protein [Pseudomonadota bacterium]